MEDVADIYLDGKPYRINLATYQSKDIIDFAPRASVPNGSVFMSDLSLYQPLVQTDWRHGFGFHWYSDASGYLITTGNIDTRQNGLVTLMTKATESDTDTGAKYGLTTFNGAVYTWGTSGLRKFDGISWSFEYSTAQVYFALNTGTYLFYCPAGGRIRKISTLGVHSDAGLDASSTDYAWLIVHNGYIYAAKAGTNQIHYDSNEDLSQLEGTTSDPGTIYCGIGNLPTTGAIVYAGQLYVARQDGLWLIGEDKIARNVLDYSDTASPLNFLSMAVINGLLVFSIRDRIVQWNGARVSDITPEKITDEFPYTIYTQFARFVASDNFLYCVARTNEADYVEDLICWDGVGWHRLMRLVAPTTVNAVTMLDYDGIFNRLWYHHHSVSIPSTRYIPLQGLSSLPYPDFPTTGVNSLITSRMDMGFRQVKKSMQSVLVEARNVTVDRYISVYYSIDGSDFIFWKDVTDNGMIELTVPGGLRTLEFNYMNLRFDFVTNDPLNSPVMESYTMRFIMRPDVRWGYSFDIIAASDVEMENMQDERTASEIKAELRTLRDSKSPIAYTGILGDTIYGYITSVKEQPVYRILAADNGQSYIEFVLSCNFVEMIEE